MIRAIIVDDEKPSLARMAKLLAASGMVEVKGEFTNPQHAFAYLQQVRIDAAFIDIEMPEVDGFELSNRLLDLQGWAAIVFVTAYNEYAVEAFRFNALDYLMKPVDKERLQETLDRILQEKNIQLQPSQAQVRCFGKFKVISGSGEIKFRTAKAEELLAYLVDCRGAEVSRSEIIDRLWPEYDGDRAVTHFNTTLHYVRKALLQNGIKVSIEHSRGSYRLNLTGVDCDYSSFLSLVSAAQVINDATISEYEEAAGLYNGDYLAGNDFQWAERNRMLLKEKYVQLLQKLADYHKSVGNYQKIVELVQTGLTHEPLHPDLNYRLIEAFTVLNDRFAAAKYLAAYRRGLKSEFGLEPDAVLAKLLGE